MKLRPMLFLIGLVVGAVGVYLWTAKRPQPLAPDAREATLVRERVAAFLTRDLRSQAREALRPLVEGEHAAAEDLVRAAAIEVSDNDFGAAEDHLARAEREAPTLAAIPYLRGQMARQEGDSERARPFLARAHELAPNDLPTAILLGAVEDDLERPAEAEKLYRSVVAAGFENGQQWYYAAVARLSNLLTQTGRDADAEPFRAVLADLEKREVKAPSSLQFLLGELGRVKPPRPMGSVVESAAPPVFRREEIVRHDLAGLRTLLVTDEGFLLHGEKGVFAERWPLPRGLTLPVSESGATRVVLLDADNDGDQDILAVHAGRCALYEQLERGYQSVAAEFPALPSEPAEIVASDWDHEGDLDLVIAGSFGARIWRRDGTVELSGEGRKAVFTDASAGSGLPADRAFTWVVTEDFDGDNDVDFLFGTDAEPFLADSLRAGKFAHLPGVFPRPVGTRPVVADCDGDARPDLWIPGESSTFVPRNGIVRASVAAQLAPGARVVSGDFDLDGALDLAWAGADGKARLLLAVGLAAERALETGLAVGTSLQAADFDRDGRIDLVFLDEDGVAMLHNEGPTGHGVTVSFDGLRDNERGVGLILEFRAGAIYRRVYWRGDPTPIGIGPHARFDVFRATWPNGVSVTDLDLALDAQKDTGGSFFARCPQPSGIVGSCPFLYAWNGTTYTFVSDVLGITPLGLPINADMLVPPDHDEYVLVTGEQLVPRDGAFELQFTEELREVTYLDHAKLVAVDHPVGTEVFPNERFTFPPFPEHHVHTVKDALAPLQALDPRGAEWAEVVARTDDRFATPFEDQPPQFAGLAKPWFLELHFDPARVARAQKLRLVMTGWFSWSDASANMASSRAPDAPFIPPILQVPDGRGGWRDAGPPVGFPAGKTKTMVIDVSTILDRADPRIRVFTSLQLFWDALRLAVDGDDAALEMREIACAGARLWRRGFSAPLDPKTKPGQACTDGQPERFDWDVTAPMPRWNQHPGLYTRLGECRELLDTIDDRFVILGSGDALTLRFDARDLAPPKPGMRRDYLVFLDGWAKDRDPNTLQALEVEPLPFHGMSGYPYRADERFPDGELHRKWRAEWNTRPAWQWIRPVAPARENEWLLAVPPRN